MAKVHKEKRWRSQSTRGAHSESHLPNVREGWRGGGAEDEGGRAEGGRMGGGGGGAVNERGGAVNEEL